MNNNYNDLFHDDFFGEDNNPRSQTQGGIEKYQARVLEYIQLEFCELGDWWKVKPDNTVNVNRVQVIGIIIGSFVEAQKINNAAGIVIDWLKSKNLISNTEE